MVTLSDLPFTVTSSNFLKLYNVDISGLEMTVQDLEKDIAIIQTENKLFKAMIEEIKLQSGNPLSQ